MLMREFQILEAIKGEPVLFLPVSTLSGCRFNKKPEPKKSGSGFKFYPTGAVQAILPFPFDKGRTTVAAKADVQ